MEIRFFNILYASTLRFFFALVFLNSQAFAGTNDDPACTNPVSTNILEDSNTTSGTKSFKKTCLPDANDNLKPTLNTRGGIYLIGNQVLCHGNNGVCEDPGTKQNNDSNLNFIYPDYDDNSSYGVSVLEANETNTSTRATLSLRSADSVIKAKLFWIARYNRNDETLANTEWIKLLTPDTNNTYKNIKCTHYGSVINDSKYKTDSTVEAYCSADVTQWVKHSGDIWVGNIKGKIASNSFSAWAMYIVYTNRNDPYQNISIYEGFDTFSNGTSLSIPLSGFLTPEQGDFNATLHVFSGESDFGFADYIQVANKNTQLITVPNPIDGNTTDFLNASISRFGLINKNRVPDFDNALGIDVDSVYIKDANGDSILENNQTSTTIKFTSDGDQLYIPMIALSTELYQPKLCYDYNYGQNGRNFTQENNGSLDPSLTGDVIPNDPINLNIYIKNLNNGSILQNVVFTLKDYNTTQVSLDGNITQTDPDLLSYYPVPSANITTTANSVYYNLASKIPNLSGIFTQLQLNPLQASLDSPLTFSLTFDIEVQGTVVNYSDYILDHNVSLCGSATEYAPEYGVFSILDKTRNQNALDLNDNNALKYNLYTQTSDRNFSTELVSFDPLNTETMKAVTDFVAVELIDAGAYHDFSSACYDPNTKITTRQWLNFGQPIPNANSPISHQEFIPQDSSFFNASRENVTFRIWRLIGDDNTTGVFTPNPDGTATLRNIADTTKSCAPASYNSVTYGQPISNYCLSTDMTFDQQKMCAECLFGFAAQSICSRDNFAMRPEAFDIKLFDIDQTLTLGSAERIASKVPQAGYDHNFSAGYSYRFEVNATTHVNAKATPGYTKYFNEGNSEHNATFSWTPKIGHDTSGCNDITSKNPNFYIKQGKLLDLVYHQERALPNVGRYTLSMHDTGWTKVDQQPSNHTGTHWTSGADCLLNNDTVPSSSIPSNQTNMGCTINSHHTNIDYPSLSTQDQVMTFFPYKFNIDGVVMQKDRNDTAIQPNVSPTLIYMSDLNQTAKLTEASKMAMRFKGKIIPAGADNAHLSNFVDKCYAQDLNISLGVSNFINANATVPHFQYRLQEQNNTHNLIYDSMAQNFNYTEQIFPDGKLQNITIPSQEFNKTEQGIFDSILSLNYERDSSVPKDIQTLEIVNYQIHCSDPLSCRSQADLSNIHEPTAQWDTNNTLFFGYGRVHAPRYRINGNSDTINIYYEVYCENSPAQECTTGIVNYGLGAESVDDVNWYINPYHIFPSREGSVTAYTPTDAVLVDFNATNYDGQGTISRTVNYHGATYPYKSKVRMATQPWMLFHPFDSSITTNDFFLEFFSNQQNWSGAIKNTESVDSTSSSTTNRRINW